MYTGTDLQWRVNGLDSKMDFTLRVAAVRVPPPSTVSAASAAGLQAASNELVGPYSPPSVFTTLPAGGGNTRSGASTSAAGGGSQAASDGSQGLRALLPTVMRLFTHLSSDYQWLIVALSILLSPPQRGERALSDQQRAFLILCGFTLFAVLVAVAVQQVMAWGGL